jgi:hypothetical protein
MFFLAADGYNILAEMTPMSEKLSALPFPTNIVVDINDGSNSSYNHDHCCLSMMRERLTILTLMHMDCINPNCMKIQNGTFYLIDYTC